MHLVDDICHDKNVIKSLTVYILSELCELLKATNNCLLVQL